MTSQARYCHGDSARDGGYLPGRTWVYGRKEKEGKDRQTDRQGNLNTKGIKEKNLD